MKAFLYFLFTVAAMIVFIVSLVVLVAEPDKEYPSCAPAGTVLQSSPGGDKWRFRERDGTQHTRVYGTRAEAVNDAWWGYEWDRFESKKREKNTYTGPWIPTERCGEKP